MTTSYGDWHTLTVAMDGEDDDGNPAPSYDLDHPGCVYEETDLGHRWECWLAELVGEFHDYPDWVGLPTEPGVYRVRAWGTPGEWAGPHYIEPDSGIEIDTDSE